MRGAHLLNASTAQRPKSHSPLEGTEPEKPINTGKASKTNRALLVALQDWGLGSSPAPGACTRCREAAVSARGHQRRVSADSWPSRPEAGRQVGLRNLDPQRLSRDPEPSLSVERAPQNKVLIIPSGRQFIVSLIPKAQADPKGTGDTKSNSCTSSPATLSRGVPYPCPLPSGIGH